MFCIAAFIVLSILGIFSVRYRRLAASAWKCVARRVSFRKCDTNFKEDLKSRLLGKTAAKHPRRARFLEKWLDVLAFIFVILMVWSLLVAVRSGLDLFVYGTCHPANSESCSLGAKACSIESVEPQFWQSLKSGHILSWGHSQVNQFGQAVSRIPDRLKKWDPASYTTKTSSYYRPYDSTKPTALEVLDPSCEFCAKLFTNLQQAGVEDRYNLTYIAFPIPIPQQNNVYKFPHSYLEASYLEAMQRQPLKGAPVPADWQLLAKLFTGKDPATGIGYQAEINLPGYGDNKVEGILKTLLAEIGYSPSQIQNLTKLSKSETVKTSIANHRSVVENQIKTVKIPTLILGTRRFEGLVSVGDLSQSKSSASVYQAPQQPIFPWTYTQY